MGLSCAGSSTNTVEIARVELDDVHCIFRALLGIAERGGFVERAAGRNDEVVRGLEQLANDFESDVTEALEWV